MSLRMLMPSLTLLTAMTVGAAEPPSAANSGQLSKEATEAGPAVDTSTMRSASPAASPPATAPQPTSAQPTPPPANTNESSQPQPARRATTSGPQAVNARPGSDRLNLDTTTVTGNRELPKVLYIVPWKKSDLGDLPSQPFNTLLDEALTPVDRDVFRREVTYYGVVNGAGSGAQSAPAPQAERSEK